MIRLLKLIVLVVGIAAPHAVSGAQPSGQVKVGPGVSYERIGRWDVDKLNQILTVDAPEFFGVEGVTYTPARNAVSLYRITYASVIPEQNNRPIVASGLLAVPEADAKNFPLVSYQHGTVFGKQQVPSFPEQSPETQLMIAQFAGQGYLLIGADYFGMGTSQEPEGYMVKKSHQQATYDMLLASRSVLDHMQLSSSKMLTAGWSQGGFVTMAFLEKLEEVGETVHGTVTASAPADIFVTLSGFLNFPRSIDADWVTTLFVLSSFSFENYYGIPGLARGVLNDEFYEAAKNFYERKNVEEKSLPGTLKELIRQDYFSGNFFSKSIYGRLIADTHAYRWVIRSPVRNYYGEADEVITPGLGRLVMTYQQAMGSGNSNVEAISTGETSHRGTYAKAVPQWKIWFDNR